VPRQQVLAIDARIGKALRELRKRRRLTLSALVPVLGVSFQQIQKIERGGNRLSVQQLLAAARFFDVGVDHFLPELHAPGAAEVTAPTSDAAVAQFAASARGKDLLRAYLALPDAKARAAVERLIRALATED
jgi:transcriptional regulator with XRE-family HTH domain